MKDIVVFIPALDPDRRLIAYVGELLKAGVENLILLDDGSDDVSRDVMEARRRVQRDPERGVLYKLATDADISDVRRCIAILNALKSVER